MALIDNIVAYWKLDESSGNAVDSTGNGYTLTNTGSMAYAAALINNGANPDANGKYLSNSSVLGFTNTTNFSISFWVKLASDNTNDRDMFALWQNGNPTGWYFRGLYEYNGGTRRLRFFRSGSTVTFLDINGNIGDNTWYHIVFTYNGSSGAMKLYKNVATTTTGGASTGTGNVGVSTQFNLTDTAGSGFAATINGLVDETGVWNKVLSDAEVTELYNGGAGLAYPFSATASNSGFFNLM